MAVVLIPNGSSPNGSSPYTLYLMAVVLIPNGSSPYT